MTAMTFPLAGPITAPSVDAATASDAATPAYPSAPKYTRFIMRYATVTIASPASRLAGTVRPGARTSPAT